MKFTCLLFVSLAVVIPKPAWAALDGLSNNSTEAALQLLLLAAIAAIPFALVGLSVALALRMKSNSKQAAADDNDAARKISTAYFIVLGLLVVHPMLAYTEMVYPKLAAPLSTIQWSPPLYPKFSSGIWFPILFVATLGLAVWARSTAVITRAKITSFIVAGLCVAAIAFLSRGLLWGPLYLFPVTFLAYLCLSKSKRAASQETPSK